MGVLNITDVITVLNLLNDKCLRENLLAQELSDDSDGNIKRTYEAK